MSQRKNYHPSGMSWREREQKKEVDRKEAEANAREEERLRKVRPTEENFPALPGLRADPKPPVTSSGMFVKLATAWKEQSDLDEMREEHRRQEEEREAQRQRAQREAQRAIAYRPNYTGRSSWYVDARDDEEEEESHTPKYGNPLEDSEGWTTVERKRRAPKKNRGRIVYEDAEQESGEHNAELYDIATRDY